MFEWTTQGLKPLDDLLTKLRNYRQQGQIVVTTNGCFDLLHTGHVTFLQQAKDLGDLLVVGLNSDKSVNTLKGPGRPIIYQEDRANMLLALASVDHVVVFDDAYPDKLLALLRPDIHCKSGDYDSNSLPEASVVKQANGTIAILPLLNGYSTSSLVVRIQESAMGVNIPSLNKDLMSSASTSGSNKVKDLIVQELLGGSNLLRHTAYQQATSIQIVANLIVKVVRRGNKILICGNGGSAADAQHFAAELVGRYLQDRAPWPALALTVDTSAITSIANDYGYENVFARQLAGLGKAGDVFVVLSTSGKSANIVNAVKMATSLQIETVALTSSSANHLVSMVDHAIIIPSQSTPLIQQAHMAAIHIICNLVETELSQSK